MVPRDKVKNLTYGYTNERAGLLTHVQFVLIESEAHSLCSCACAVRTTADVSRQQAFLSPCEALSEGEIGRQEIKMLRFIWQNNWYSTWLSIIKTKYTCVMKHFNASKPWKMRFSLDYDKNSSKIGDEPWHNFDTVGSLLLFTWS